MTRLEQLVHRLNYPLGVSNEDIFDTIQKYWDDVSSPYQQEVDESLAEELGVTPTALAELLEVNRHTFDYANIGGNSSVRGYDHGEDWFVVMFSDGSRYLYTLKSTDRPTLDYMRTLAIAGKGLNSYITRTVRTNYAGRNHKGTITIKPGMEHFNPQGFHRLKLLEAFRNTMTTPTPTTLKVYSDQIEKAGSDGLGPQACQAMAIGLESMGVLNNEVTLESFDESTKSTDRLKAVIVTQLAE